VKRTAETTERGLRRSLGCAVARHGFGNRLGMPVFRLAAGHSRGSGAV
jgi:hypothetical protein